MNAKSFLHAAALAPVFFACIFFVARPPAAQGEELSAHARQFNSQLAEKILPYWFDTAQDTQFGGYLLADDGKGKRNPTEKQLVSQTRMIWTFSMVHRRGFSTDKRNYLKAAAQGYKFLREHFYDTGNGGYYWKTDLAGKVLDDRKLVYGESFVIYALTEYYRASGDQEALRQALELYQLLQKKAYDPQHTGWAEHFYRDWKPLPKFDPNAQVEVAGYKSANTHLHLMEALAELYEASRDSGVKKSLEEAVNINASYFYPANAGKSCFHRQPDWKEVTDPKSAGLSYGHNVEFAWLLIRAEEVLGRTPSWEHFYAHLQHALKYGYDHERGGLYNRGFDDQPATQTDKIWWVEAEMMAALTDALKHHPEPGLAKALDKLIHFITTYQTDPKDGIWYSDVAADGKVKSASKANSWKANYHDVRAIMKFVDMFAPGKN